LTVPGRTEKENRKETQIVIEEAESSADATTDHPERGPAGSTPTCPPESSTTLSRQKSVYASRGSTVQEAGVRPKGIRVPAPMVSSRTQKNIMQNLRQNSKSPLPTDARSPVIKAKQFKNFLNLNRHLGL